MSATITALHKLAIDIAGSQKREEIATEHCIKTIKRCNQLTARSVFWEFKYYEAAGYPVRRYKAC